MANAAPNHIKYLLATGAIDFSSDVFRIILMDDTFVFDVDNHAEYADVVANELATLNGYTQFTQTLAGVVVTEDDVNDRANIAWNNTSWTAVGGAIGPASGACIIDDSVANDPIVGYLDFLGNYTQPDGGTVTLINISVRIP